MDRIEQLGQSLIQHGHDNDRIYLMKLHPDDLEHMPASLMAKARQKGYSKIFCKLPELLASHFLDRGYEQEAQIPQLFFGLEKGVFISCFLKPERKQVEEAFNSQVMDNLELAYQKRPVAELQGLSSKFTMQELDETHATALAELYQAVFASYPFPIFDSEYLIETMRSHIRYFGIFEGDNLVAASSAEQDLEAGNAEMTDFATLPDWRGNGLALHLLLHMEKILAGGKVKTVYTIARALEAGMNITFTKGDYRYGGTLVNNTQIGGRLESMNVWYKSLG